jgi:branched-chain amino acid transport system permease protein
MIDFFLAYQPLVDVFLLHSGLAYSQYIVKRAGVFSVATAGFAAIGAYSAAILCVRYGVNPLAAILIATLLGTLAGVVLSWPLARLRDVYQAIATLAFVQVVVSLNLYAEPLTGGAMGFTGIPKHVGTLGLAAALAAVVYIIASINATRIGRAFEAIRQDEAMAASLGVSITGHQALAFALSGAIAGLFGALEALHGRALEPNQFGFALLIAALSYVVLGGRRSTIGPLVGTAVLVALPELARPLAENRLLVYGMLLMAVIAYLPRGVADTLIDLWRRRRMARIDARLARSAQ